MLIDPKEIIDLLRRNLQEQYKFDGGRTLLRELLQNADDAEATSVKLAALPGWPDAEHPLLRVPGLLLANDGRFDEASCQGMDKFGGSLKATDKTAVGRFGLGQKSVFHICDAFIVVSEGYEPAVPPFVVNPFMAIARPGDNCQTWQDPPSDKDHDRLLSSALKPNGAARQMVQWFPLRRPDLRPKSTSAGFLSDAYDLSQLYEIADAFWLSSVLAMLRNISRLEVVGPDEQVTIIDRGISPRLRFQEEDVGEYAFGGQLGDTCRSVGREVMQAKSYGHQLIGSPGWPDIRNRDTDEMQKQKALPHGAVVLVFDPDGPGRLDVTWSVFLPVQAEAAIPLTQAGTVQIILHGYFFVDSGRSKIVGFDPAQAFENNQQIEASWNTLIRDGLVLPMLPSVFSDALSRGVLDETKLAEIVVHLNSTSLVRRHRGAISSRHFLARTLDDGKISWRLHDAGLQFRPLPQAEKSRLPRLLELIPNLVEHMADMGLVPTVGGDAVLAPVAAEWELGELSQIVGLLTPDVFKQGGNLARFSEFLDFARPGIFTPATALQHPILLLLRKAMIDPQSVMAEAELIQNVLKHLPPGCVFGMPASVMERRLLREKLAAIPEAPLCVNAAWIPDGWPTQVIDLAAATALLTALQPLLNSSATEDAAGTAAVTILKALGPNLSVAIADPVFRKLDVLRVDQGTGIASCASLAALVQASQARKLFKMSPAIRKLVRRLEDAAPGCGAMIINSAEISSLLDDMGGDLAFAGDPKMETARMAGQALDHGPDDARKALLDVVWDDDPRYRPWLRVIVAGTIDARSESRELFWITGRRPLLDDFVRRLLGNGENSILLSSTILSTLDDDRQAQLGVKRLESAALGKMLVDNRRHIATQSIGRDLMTEIFSADIPNEDLRNLPLFVASNGTRVSAAEGYRRNASWEIPNGLEKTVPIIDAPFGLEAKRRFELLVREWSRDTQLEHLLDQAEPHRQAEEIVDALHHKVTDAVAEKLKQRPWLETADGLSVSPSDVLDLPDELEGVPSRDGELQLVALTDIRPGLLSKTDVVLLREMRILPDQSSSRERLIARLREKNVLSWIGERATEVATALQVLAKDGATLGLPGWPLLSFFLSEGGADPIAVLKTFPTSQNPKPEEFSNWLQTLARYSKAGSAEARAVYDCAFRVLARLPNDQRRTILIGVPVPTQAGTWQDASLVAGHGGAISFAHRLDAELAVLLPKDGFSARDDIGRPRRAKDVTDLTEVKSASSLEKIIAYAQPAVPGEMLAVLVTMIGGQTPEWRRVLDERLNISSSQIEAIQNRYEKEVAACYQPTFSESLAERRGKMRILFSGQEAVSGRADVETLTGETCELPLGDVEPLDVVGQISIGWWTDSKGIRHRDLNVATPSGVEVADSHVRKFCALLADEFIGSEKTQPESRRAFDGLLDAFAKIEERTAEAVQAELKDQLPGILKALKPAPGSRLREARDSYERDIQRAGTEAEAQRSALKDVLWTKVHCPAGHAELLDRVRYKTEEQGYSASRTFFELFQNADDAWQQHPASDSDPGKFTITRTDRTTSIRHWGRLINDVGTDIGYGEAKGWHNDLHNMLVLNLSDKESGGTVTGRFGLGFKSVHLLADEVRIASRYVACHVRGGMLPEPWFDGRAISFAEKKFGRPATIVEIDNKDQDPAFEEAWSSFRKCARWLPAMGRSIRSIELSHGTRIEVFDAAFEPTKRHGIRILSMTGSAPGKALALDLDDDTTLFLQLGNYGPVVPSADTPGLWLLAPLQEDYRPAWLLNSRTFRVNPGRGQLVGTPEERQCVFRQHGNSLARLLNDLAEMITTDWEAFAEQAGLASLEVTKARTLFWTALADVFTRDLSTQMLAVLHVDAQDADITDLAGRTDDSARRGWARLVCTQRTFPTRLPAPFVPLVRAETVRWQLAGLLAVEEVWPLLNGSTFTSEILERSVSDKAGAVLQGIGIGRPARLDGGDFFALVLNRGKRVEPVTASWLGTILNQAPGKSLLGDEFERIVAALRDAEFRMQDGTWGTVALMPRDRAEANKEEIFIAAMAPDNAVLSSDYEGMALALYHTAQSSGRFGTVMTSRNFANWARQANTLDRQRAVLTYLIHGEKGQDVAHELQSGWPHWLPRRFEDLCDSPLCEGMSPDALKQQVLPHLYQREHLARLHAAESFRFPEVDDDDEAYSEPPDQVTALERLHAWWELNRKKLASRHDFDTWPRGMKPTKLIDKTAEQDPEGWFSFFALGVFYTIGRASPQANRNFIMKAHTEGWWGEMARVHWTGGHDAWTARLDEIATTDEHASDYPQWRRMLADLYVVARWLPEYVDVFHTLPRIVERDGTIRLSDLWWPSASPSLQRRGTEGASLVRSLGIGANWMIREAVRSDFWGDHGKFMHPYGWANTDRMGRFGQSLGWSLPDRKAGMEASPDIHDLFSSVLGGRASFGGDLSLPVQLIMAESNSEDRRRILGADSGSSTVQEDLEELVE